MKNRFLIYLFAIVLFTSCHTSKEILYFQDIAVNSLKRLWVQETSPCSPRTKFPSWYPVKTRSWQRCST